MCISLIGTPRRQSWNISHGSKRPFGSRQRSSTAIFSGRNSPAPGQPRRRTSVEHGAQIGRQSAGILLGAEKDKFALHHILGLRPLARGFARLRLAARLETMPSSPGSAAALKNRGPSLSGWMRRRSSDDANAARYLAVALPISVLLSDPRIVHGRLNLSCRINGPRCDGVLAGRGFRPIERP
jgi:hypothetical protein